MIHELPQDRAALVAASQASEAVTELLRFHGEGPQRCSAFGEVDVVEKLADALLHASRIAGDCLGSQDQDYRENLGQIAAACAKFIDGWVG